MTWISVKERLPHDQTPGKVYVALKQDGTPFLFGTGGGCFCVPHQGKARVLGMDEFTHWTELPELPPGLKR